MITLKTCPFCGAKAVAAWNKYSEQWCAICISCYAHTPDKFGSAREAANAWNQRADEILNSPQDGVINEISKD